MSDSDAQNRNSTDRPPGPTLLRVGLPAALLVGLIAYVVSTGGGLSGLTGPPVEKLHIQRITMPEKGLIRVHAVNDGPQPVEIAQVLVDEAYWKFQARPSAKLDPRESVVVDIPYHWVPGAAHHVSLVSSRGNTFGRQIPAAVQAPSASLSLVGQFGLVGLYVGVVPITLGLLWFPFLAGLPRRWLDFVLALTLGLLAYLAVATWEDALEFGDQLASFWQGTPLVVAVAALTLLALIAVGQTDEREANSRLGLAYRIALGIGLHNLGEGLAIGAAYASGEAALGTFLILGFTLHNVTEGIGIAAPIAERNPSFGHFVGFVLLAGAPAVAGTWIGGFAFNPVLAAIFFAAGVGAILQVLWEVGALVVEGGETGRSARWLQLTGFAAGIAAMYLTGFMTA
ncbi:MAG: ZIP family metal transporter [Bradymonadaceae bacterium]